MGWLIRGQLRLIRGLFGLIEVSHPVSHDAQRRYDIRFNRRLVKPAPTRTLAETRADIMALEERMPGLLGDIVGEHGL